MTHPAQSYPDHAAEANHARLPNPALALDAAASSPRGGPQRALTYLYLFRRVAVALALVGATVAWVEQIPWLLAASVCIGIGEFLETSYYVGVLRWGQRQGSLLQPTRAERAEASP